MAIDATIVIVKIGQYIQKRIFPQGLRGIRCSGMPSVRSLTHLLARTRRSSTIAIGPSA
ncbi:hypothetical protein BDQ17DRAFT_1342792 [Cyathus striatus]|nr:hypothetical protein BDQ17DRAFT_1342792 [Cyathus striatus]